MFDDCVQPPKDAEWNKEAEVHGFSATHPSIYSDRKTKEIWKSFCLFVNNNIFEDKVGCVVAWNGGGSDMKWISHLTQATDASKSLPLKLKYFLGPFRAITAHSSCTLNSLASLSLITL